jgi:hypothetical protein
MDWLADAMNWLTDAMNGWPMRPADASCLSLSSGFNRVISSLSGIC